MLDDLLLLRLWAAPDAARGETRAKVAADLRPIAADPAQGRENWQTTVAAAVERLTRAGCLTASGRQGGRLQLSVAGRNRVQTVFHLPVDSETPGKKRTAGWAWWRDHYALPLALGGQHPGTADGLRSALLRRFYLPELAGRSHADRLQKAVDLLLAKRLKVTRISPAAFRQAALQEWARRQSSAEAGVSRSASPDDGSAHSAGRLPDHPALFAAAVVAAAARSPTGRFGEKKVFIAHVWRELLAGGFAAPPEEDSFKERLIRENTAGRLHLSRADLAGAHDPGDVRASEIHYLGEKFHFVRLD